MEGLFLACYEIGGDKPGAPLFKVQLMVDPLSKTVTGRGQITQATNPPLDIATKLDGSYTYITVMPDNVRILVTLIGHPPIWTPHGGLYPVIPPNVELRMVLEEDWHSGTANYKYVDDNGNWHEIEGAPVKAVPCNTLQ